MAENPDIQLPQNGEKIVKVVQLYIDGRPILRLGPKSVFHASILERILAEFGLAFEKQKTPFGREVPKLRGERYEAVGMGQCQLFNKEYCFYGDSGDYNIKINREHLQKCREKVPDVVLEVTEL